MKNLLEKAAVTENSSVEELKQFAEMIGIKVDAKISKVVLWGVIEKAMDEAREDVGEIKPGRPVDPTSASYKRRMELEARRANGELRRGRPVDPESARQKSIAERGEGEGTGQRGRPVDVNSESYKRKMELEAKRESGELKRGRTPDLSSARQQRIAAQMKRKLQASGVNDHIKDLIVEVRAEIKSAKDMKKEATNASIEA